MTLGEVVEEIEQVVQKTILLPTASRERRTNRSVLRPHLAANPSNDPTHASVIGDN